MASRMSHNLDLRNWKEDPGVLLVALFCFKNIWKNYTLRFISDFFLYVPVI